MVISGVVRQVHTVINTIDSAAGAVQANYPSRYSIPFPGLEERDIARNRVCGNCIDFNHETATDGGYRCNRAVAEANEEFWQ